MKSKFLTLLFLPLFLLSSCNEDVLKLSNGNNEEIDVIFVHGQSNADGRSKSNDLKSADKEAFDHFYSDSENVFAISDGCSRTYNDFETCSFKKKLSGDFFGPEIGIRKYYEEKFPNKKLVVIKSAFGGTVLYSQWLYNGTLRFNLYNRALSFDKESIRKLTEMKYKPVVKGVCWMQGESDGCVDEAYANHYYDATVNLVSFFREDLKEFTENIRFVDAGISESFPQYKIINDAKKKYSLISENTRYFSTIDAGLKVMENDLAHYDATSMIKLGYLFAENLFN